MSRQLLMPELAESVIEGEILKWLVQEGERVELEQPICEVMTDKVTVELPSPFAGVLEKHLAPEGAVVAVHAALALEKLSYMPFIFKAVVAALKKYPSLNTSLDEASGEVVQKNYYHLGIAVTTDVGLTVPVIRDADRLSLLELGQQVNTLAGKARSNTLTPGEMAGSSFSVTNIGSVGALFSFPIINVPDAAILGVHSIVRRPIVDADGQIVAADMMYLSLSFDHRLVDGAEAARFCKEVIRLLENPELLMISI